MESYKLSAVYTDQYLRKWNDAWTCKPDKKSLEYLDVSPRSPHNTFGSNTLSHAGDQMREDPNLFEYSLLL